MLVHIIYHCTKDRKFTTIVNIKSIWDKTGRQKIDEYLSVMT